MSSMNPRRIMASRLVLMFFEDIGDWMAAASLVPTAP